MAIQVRLMGDREEAEGVWDDLEAALAERDYEVRLEGTQRNEGTENEFRFYGVVE